MTLVAIMQPTFLPWCGYFALINHVDKFILLDTVQFARRSWQQRNQIKTAQGAKWLTVPVISKGLRDQKILDVQIDLSRGFPSKQIRTLEVTYNKTRYFKNFGPELFNIMNNHHKKLSDLSIEIIKWMCEKFEIKTPFINASEIPQTGNKENLLVSLCQQIDAKHYVSPPGSHVYLEESDAFNLAKIKLSYFQYQHPIYTQQHGSFLSHMSALDLIFNCGYESREILLSGYSLS